MSVKLNISASEADVLRSLAEHFVATGKDAIDHHGRYSVSLSGGSSPKKLYELLVSDYATALDWTKVDFFFGDERNVPRDDKNSNYLMAKTALFEPLQIADAQVFPIKTEFGPEAAAEAYTDAINTYFKSESPQFDLMLLGLGDNSHTASLFPYTPVLHDTSVSVRALYIDEVKMYRITMTAALINLSRHIAFLVYGAGKAEAIKHILEDDLDIELYPAQLITQDGDVQWFMDEPAAAALSKK
ncbi:6-phosphogluconolactonase [Mucilaginibacter yixingensis]|uniref:6-phosphogluconolactonase n=1 Tax=Mucilaginibacter yixingensis TaxID=1295612 RepID=A0A2T5J6Q9_9SPHI|nr:6-phosphogluconolactonase [Mucilaginibacter yixingensis]PTQ94842.1 6-phosphogluconolactonase [Mucilaginibacter yixingensis]